MEEEGLRSIHLRRKQRSLTDSRKARGDGYPNLVRGLQIDRPFQVLSSDISYIRTQEGFAYLCQVKDVASGMILASGMSERMKAELVLETIRQAVRSWHLSRGCIFHSGRKIRQSFSRVGMPGDYSWSESFFATLKKEAVHRVHFNRREEARHGIFAYIEGFYNTKRIQKRLGYLSPLKWLEAWYKNNSAAVA